MMRYVNRLFTYLLNNNNNNQDGRFSDGLYDSETPKTPNRKQYGHVTFTAMAAIDRAQSTLWAKVVSDCVYLIPIPRYGRRKSDYVIAKKLEFLKF